jgi:hypothetical protein
MASEFRDLIIPNSSGDKYSLSPRMYRSMRFWGKTDLTLNFSPKTK